MAASDAQNWLLISFDQWRGDWLHQPWLRLPVLLVAQLELAEQQMLVVQPDLVQVMLVVLVQVVLVVQTLVVLVLLVEELLVVVDQKLVEADHQPQVAVVLNKEAAGRIQVEAVVLVVAELQVEMLRSLQIHPYRMKCSIGMWRQ